MICATRQETKEIGLKTILASEGVTVIIPLIVHWPCCQPCKPMHILYQAPCTELPRERTSFPRRLHSCCTCTRANGTIVEYLHVGRAKGPSRNTKSSSKAIISSILSNYHEISAAVSNRGPFVWIYTPSGTTWNEAFSVCGSSLLSKLSSTFHKSTI